MLNTESRLLDLGRAGFGKACGVADAVRLEAVLAERRDLSSEQAAMVRSLCSSGNGVEVVIGVPGSGKTFALDAARRAWQSSGYRVDGAALVAEAAAQLEAGSGLSSATLDRLLYELSRAAAPVAVRARFPQCRGRRRGEHGRHPPSRAAVGDRGTRRCKSRAHR